MDRRRRLRSGSPMHLAASVLVFVGISAAPGLAFDTGHHYDLTRETLQEQGFGNTPIKIAQVDNWLVDYYSNPTEVFTNGTVGHLHFDNLYSTEMVSNYWGQFTVNTQAAVQKAVHDNDPLELLTLIGMSLHSVQDFYTHSNWVETHPAPADGTYRTDTWFSTPPKQGDTLIHTGWYKDDPGAPSTQPQITPTPAEPIAHGDYTSGLNHDSYVRPNWDRSYVFAYAGCREWVNAIRTWVNNPTLWDRARQYSAAGDDLKALNKDLDAAYRISEWIFVPGADGHWKGNGSGSATDFLPAVVAWKAPPTSTYVTKFKSLLNALTPNLKDGIAATAAPNAAVPTVTRVAFDRTAVLVRTTHAQETAPPAAEAANVKADFYARVSVAQHAFVDAMQLHSDDIRPSWTTIKFLPANTASVPVHYELWDERNVGGGECDISPAAGENALDFTYTLATHGCAGDITGVHDSDAAAVTSQGDSGPGDLVQFYVTTLTLAQQQGDTIPAPQSPDTTIAALPPTLEAAASASGAAGSLPATFSLLTGAAHGAASITLTNVHYDAGSNPSAGAPVSGHADLSVTLAGMNLVTIPACPFQNMVVDAQGVVSGGGISLSNDLVEPNIFGTGADLTIGKGSQVTVLTKGEKVSITGSLKSALPYFSSSGAQAQATIPQAAAEVSASGDFKLDADNVTLTGATSTEGLSLAGFNFKAASFQIKLENTVAPASFTFSVTANHPIIGTNVPNLLCQDDAPLTLQADSATIDRWGLPSFTNASIATVVDSRGQQRPQVLRLAQPLDFSITVNSVSASVAAGSITDFSMTGDLTLPHYFTGDNGDLVTIQNLSFELKKGFVVAFDVPANKPIAVKWDNFGVEVTDRVIVDLSSGAASTEIPPDAPDDIKTLTSSPAWEGVYFKRLSLLLPASMTGSGAAQKVPGTNFLIDGHGISGTVDIAAGVVPTLTIENFSATLTSARFVIDRSTLTAGNVYGNVTIPAWDNQKVAIKASISSSGLATVGLDLQSPLHVSSLGMEVTLSGGSFQIASNGSTQLLLSGAFAFPGIDQLKDASVEFTNLGIGSDGKIHLPNSNWVTLPHPTTIDLSLLTLECTQVGFGQDPNNSWWVGLTGGVKVSSDLPLSGGVQFDGLTVHADPAGPKLQIGGIHLVAEVLDVVTIEAGLTEQTVNGIDCLYGDAGLTLDFAGPAGSMGGALHFLVAKNAWFVVGSVSLPASGIPLGNSGISIFGFEGGIGHNVEVKPGLGGPPIQATDVVPVPDSGSWLFLAGVTIGTSDGVTFWGPVTLTVGLPQLAIDLHGQFYFLQPVNNPTPDRTGWVDINWASSTGTFWASLGAHLVVPGGGINILQADGYAELLLSPNDKHVWVGWPMDQHPLKLQIAGGVLTAAGGAMWDIQNSKFQARLIGDLGVGPICDAHLDASLIGSYNPTDPLSIDVSGSAHFTGNADFGPFTAYADAWLAGQMLGNPPTLKVSGGITATIKVPGGSESASAQLDVVAAQGQPIQASLSDISVSWPHLSL